MSELWNLINGVWLLVLLAPLGILLWNVFMKLLVRSRWYQRGLEENRRLQEHRDTYEAPDERTDRMLEDDRRQGRQAP